MQIYKKMKKILLLIPALNAGGAERVMVTLANEWCKIADVTIMVFNDGKCFYNLEKAVQIKAMNIVLAKRGLRRKLAIPLAELKRLYKILSDIKSGGYDFILSFCYSTNVLASIASMILKKENIIISERNDPYRYSKCMKKTVDFFYKRCKVIVCQNTVVKNYFRSRNFNNKLLVLPNPVCFSDIPKQRPEKTKRCIISVGRLIEQKNQKLLIEAFDEIKDEFPEYSLKICGIGPLEDILKTLIIEKNLENRVFLIGTKKRAMYEVNNNDIFALTSDYEGFPNVLVEAMATGMPVISSDFKTGVARELITNKVNGYLFEVGNREQLVNCMRELINRRSEFYEIGRKNRKIAERYREDIIAEDWMREIEVVVNRCIRL